MPLFIPNVGASDALDYFTNRATPEDLVLKLYTNDYTPVEGSVAGDFTEASGSGYSPITLTGSSWGAPADLGGLGMIATYAAQRFTFSGSLGNVYGYYLVRSSSGVLAGAERFSDGPYNITASGDYIEVTPSVGCSGIS